jgi:NADPH:quinone reductase-like Zn-dependent oxidoreductase
MNSQPAATNRPVRPESFTARTLRLSVRAANVAAPIRSAPTTVIADPVEEPQETAKGMLLVRIEAESAMPFDGECVAPTSTLDSCIAALFGIAGTIEAIAGGAPDFQVGDAVFGVTTTRPFNGANQRVVVEASRMARMPPRLSFIEAASSSLVGTSAWQMLFKIGRIEAGEAVLILGADTPIGMFAVQLAAIHGVRTIALMKSLCSENELLRLGAHRVVDGSPGRLEMECRSASLVVDTIGGALHRRAAASIQSGCTLVSCVERPDVFTTAWRGTRSLFCVPDATTHCLARIATLIDEAFLTSTAISGECP